MRKFGQVKALAAVMSAVIMMAAGVSAQGKPKIAVYVTSGADKSMAAKTLAAAGAHKAVGDGLAKAIGAAGKCDAVNLTGDITKAHGAMVSEAQAAAIGSRFGIQYLCIVQIRDVKGKTFNTGVGLADVSRGQRVAAATAAIDMSNAPGMLQAFGKIAQELVKGVAASAVQNAAQGAAGGGAGAAPAPTSAYGAAGGGAYATHAPASAYESSGGYVTPAEQYRKPAQPVKPPERLWIAVYVRGSISDDVKTAFRNALLFTFVKNKLYNAVNNNGAFVAALNKLAAGQNDDDLNDMQIVQTGDSLNLDFVCVVNVLPVLGGYQVLSRVIDVKDLTVARMGQAVGAIASASDLSEIADKLVESMFTASEVPRTQEKLLERALQHVQMTQQVVSQIQELQQAQRQLERQINLIQNELRQIQK